MDGGVGLGVGRTEKHLAELEKKRSQPLRWLSGVVSQCQAVEELRGGLLIEPGVGR